MTVPKQKILMVAATPFFSDRGCHIRIYNEIKNLSKNDYEIVLATYHNGKNVDGLSIQRIGNVAWYKKINPGASFAKLYLDVLLLFKTLKIYRQIKPTIIHAHLYEGLGIAFLTKFFTFSRVPIIFDFQGSLAEEMYAYHLKKNGILKIFYGLFWMIEKLMLFIPDAIVCSSENGKKVLADVFKVSVHKITVVNDGFELPKNQTSAQIGENEKNVLKQKLNIPIQNKVVVYTGSLTEAKGVKAYLDVIPEILTKIKDVTFLFVGYGDLQRESTQNIVFTGHVSYFELSKYLSLADLAIDPKVGRSESSAKIMNYLAHGIPTVCFSIPIADLQPYVTVISNFTQLVPIINKLPEKKQLSEEIIERYSISSEITKLEKVYEIESSKPAHVSIAYNVLILALISIICVIIFNKYSSINLLITIINKIDLRLLGLSFIIYLIIYWLRAFRFSLISPLKSITANFDVNAIHTFVNNILPAETGELAYPYLLKKLHNVSYSKSVADLSLVRIFDFANVCVFLFAGILAFNKFGPMYLLLFILLAQICLVGIYAILIRSLNGIIRISEKPNNFFTKVKDFVGRIIKHQAVHSFGKLLVLHLLSFLITFIMFLYGFILMRALGLNIQFQFFVIGWCFSLIGSFIPIQGFFGFGSIEAGWFFPLVAAGISSQNSIALSVNYHFIGLLSSLVVFGIACGHLLIQKLAHNRLHK